MPNNDIRQAIRTSGIKQWEVADALGISEATITRWLRKELSDEKKSAILNIITAIKERK